ncbi:MAG: class I SAM-dependent methyltransferase [Isosphaeraceae bacterium]|nr:class I SAM-dependent methyltransferase [Isosphaeraceae bacterium]
MDPKHLEELIAVESRYWWHVSKRRLVTALLKKYLPPPGRLIEGGVGGGGNLVAFREMGYDVSGFDLMPESVEHCRRTLQIADVAVHDLGEPWPAEPRSARAVVMLDVIEHVPDPVRVLRNAAELLEPGGGIVVTVPAIPALMGPWDEMLGHYRRYSRPMLREQAEAAGLTVKYLSHWNSFTLPAAIAVRLFEKMTGQRRSAEFPAVSPTVNALLKGLANAERRLITRVPLSSGLSLIGVLTHERRAQGGAKADRRGPALGRAAGLQRGEGARNPAA